jgi:hypothetical protein
MLLLNRRSTTSMSTTNAQILANRENAIHSTGPVTPDGKATSSKNGIRHGLAASIVLILGESREDFEALKSALTEEHRPTTPTETLLVH